MPAQSDHDLLVIIGEQQKQMAAQLLDALEQLKRGNERFVSISLRDQEVGAAITGLRQDYSRAMLIAEQAKVGVEKLGDDFERFRTQLKTIAWVAGPLIGISVALATELIKHWLIGP